MNGFWRIVRKFAPEFRQNEVWLNEKIYLHTLFTGVGHGANHVVSWLWWYIRYGIIQGYSHHGFQPVNRQANHAYHDQSRQGFHLHNHAVIIPPYSPSTSIRERSITPIRCPVAVIWAISWLPSPARTVVWSSSTTPLPLVPTHWFTITAPTPSTSLSRGKSVFMPTVARVTEAIR